MGIRLKSLLTLMIVAVAIDLSLSLAWFGLAVATAPDTARSRGLAVLWGDEERFGPETERRVRHALDLWRASGGRAMILCVGGARPAHGFHGARMTCDRMVQSGVPAHLVRIGSGSNDTVSNLQELAALTWESGLREVTVVTDPLHTFRARIFLNGAADGLRLDWAPYAYGAAKPEVGILDLWVAVHLEWAGLASLLIPESIRGELLARLRG